ncbi:glycosyltransferase involved in cell wall biosynthesis [Pedobacter cryoconitis]|uniref:Glycosyltransferase involved in cell wall biosynthesis n=1 Tax=Pedobacter cryoconitis TaxID=188932 RepID=A0A7W9DKM1_9SPHI|nr:glycosyltransferase family 2 protein [Pedobacter cryoconitis]MBB5622328.1 glycosyltransferase involved in cell wall biosynthesis [Pedobacter cryoconitis]
MARPTVSVWIITYNHEKYIAQTLDSVLMQRTDFDFEIVIGEDCSRDGTRAILKRYEAEYPDKFNIIYHETNVGAMRNAYEFALPACKGKYIACLEGDDYWTDCYKLQKQFEALENNPEYSMCFHNAKVIYQNLDKPSYLLNKVDQKKILYFDDLVERWQIATASMFFRNYDFKLPDWFYNQYNGDMALQFILIDNGPFLYLEDLMSVYRLHDTGISSTKITSQITMITNIINLLDLVNDFYSQKYNDSIQKAKAELNAVMLRVKVRTRFPLLQTLRLSVKKSLTFVSDKL